MQRGTKVRIKSSADLPAEFNSLVRALGDVELEVADVTSIGMCTIILPNGKTLGAYSRPLSGPMANSRHYIDIYQDNLEEVV